MTGIYIHIYIYIQGHRGWGGRGGAGGGVWMIPMGP